MADGTASVAPLPIDRTNLTLADRVETLLRDAVVQGEHPPGARLSEADIARSYGVSRGPVREALRRLEHHGLVTVEPHRGAFVRTLDLEEVRELFEVRIALEAEAAELAAGRIDAAGVAELRRLAQTAGEEVARSGRSGVFDTHDLHDLVVRLAGNQRLARTVAQVNAELRLARSRSGATGSRAVEAVGEHDRLVDALVSRDARGAREAMRDHLGAALRNTLTLLQPTYADGRAG
ncbi:GntR family transcriptional regulator [Pseudonocardia halophobica]|uniref:GntR family transcriptional regulator n=1 Tax=Pseudonocardia halophobica TaxID=29401 RepID=UPI003D9053A9